MRIVRTDGADTNGVNFGVCRSWRAKAETEEGGDGELKSHGENVMFDDRNSDQWFSWNWNLLCALVMLCDAPLLR